MAKRIRVAIDGVEPVPPARFWPDGLGYQAEGDPPGHGRIRPVWDRDREDPDGRIAERGTPVARRSREDDSRDPEDHGFRFC